MKEVDIPNITFCICEVPFNFLLIALGLCNSSSTFHNLMNKIFSTLAMQFMLLSLRSHMDSDLRSHMDSDLFLKCPNVLLVLQSSNTWDIFSVRLRCKFILRKLRLYKLGYNLKH